MKLHHIILLTTLLLTLAGSAFAAPSKISFQNISGAGKTNDPATCSIVGVLDSSDKINDNAERINLPSLRTFALTKGGMANYSTSLNSPRGNQFKIACVKTSTGENLQLKMYFDSVSSRWFPVTSGLFRFY
jgi:hypothetical protein